MHYRTPAILTISLLLLAGCATTKKYEAQLNTWVGKDIEELVSEWGYQDKTIEASNGNKVYVYSTSRTHTAPVQTKTRYSTDPYSGKVTSRSTSYGGQTHTKYCDTFFEVDSSNKIVKWKTRGDDCKSK